MLAVGFKLFRGDFGSGLALNPPSLQRAVLGEPAYAEAAPRRQATAGEAWNLEL